MTAIEIMAPAMFLALVVFLLIGLPVAFSLAALGLASGFVAIELGLFPPAVHGEPALSCVWHSLQ